MTLRKIAADLQRALAGRSQRKGRTRGELGRQKRALDVGRDFQFPPRHVRGRALGQQPRVENLNGQEIHEGVEQVYLGGRERLVRRQAAESRRAHQLVGNVKRVADAIAHRHGRAQRILLIQRLFRAEPHVHACPRRAQLDRLERIVPQRDRRRLRHAGFGQHEGGFQFFSVRCHQPQHHAIRLGDLHQIAQKPVRKFRPIRVPAQFGTITEHRDQTLITGRQLGGHVGQRLFGLGQAALQITGVRQHPGAGGPRAAHDQNILARMPQVKHFIHERLHQIEAASVFGIPFRQRDFRRPVEAGGVVGDSRFKVALAGGKFKDHGMPTPPGPGVLHGVVPSLDE